MPNLDQQVALNTENIAKRVLPNLLDNPWFTVNQRGYHGTLSTANLLYGSDRWKFCPNAQVGDGYAYLPKNTYVCQPMEDMSWIVGKVITISFMERSGVIHSKTITAVSPYTDYTEGTWRVTTDFRSDSSRVLVWNLADTGMYVKAVKLELGSYSTLAYDVEPNYAEELLKCQRYYWQTTRFYRSFVSNYSNGLQMIEVEFPVEMRVTPDVTRQVADSDANTIYIEVTKDGYVMYRYSGASSPIAVTKITASADL